MERKGAERPLSLAKTKLRKTLTAAEKVAAGHQAPLLVFDVEEAMVADGKESHDDAGRKPNPAVAVVDKVSALSPLCGSSDDGMSGLSHPSRRLLDCLQASPTEGPPVSRFDSGPDSGFYLALGQGSMQHVFCRGVPLYMCETPLTDGRRPTTDDCP